MIEIIVRTESETLAREVVPEVLADDTFDHYALEIVSGSYGVREITLEMRETEGFEAVLDLAEYAEEDIDPPED